VERNRLSTLQELWRPKLVKVGSTGVAVVAGYDAASNQFGFFKIGELLGMSGSLLPWWGWLLILQTIFIYALFEYVRRQFSSGSRLPEGHALTTEDVENIVSRKIGQLNQTATVAEALDLADTRTSAVAVSVSERIDRLDGKVETMGKLASKANELQREQNEFVQTQLAAAVADAKAATDYAQGSIAGVQHILGELRDDQGRAGQDYQAFKKVIERGLKNVWEKLERRCEFIDQGFAAILDRERLLSLADTIESKGEELSAPTRGEPVASWDDWAVHERRWRAALGDWCHLADAYRVGVTERVNDKPEEKYLGRWKADDGLFPDSATIYSYKTFRIILSNFREERKHVESCVRLAAFARPSLKGRFKIPQGEDQTPMSPEGR
jgi:hypothetical protein